MDADVIVIGGGPAGAMAAYQLAARARVLVLERSRLPRDKTCSGVLSAKSLHLLTPAVDIHPALCGQFAETRLGLGRHLQLHRHTPMLIANRGRLDFRLLEAAARRGARVEPGERVRTVDPEHGRVELTSGIVLNARVVIGADGASGVTSRSLNGAIPDHAVAMEARVEDPRAAGHRSAVIQFGVPRGYFWVFPHDHQVLAVGGGSADRRLFPALRGMVTRWAQKELGLEIPDHLWHAYLVPCRGVRQVVQGRTMLAGDAAGLADPLLGEGIAYALWSGALAAEVCGEHLDGGLPLHSYARLIETRIVGFQRPFRTVAGLPYAGSLLGLALQVPSVRRLGWRKVVERAPDAFGVAIAPACETEAPEAQPSAGLPA